MTRALRLTLLVTGLLWLAPAVRALPLSADEAMAAQQELLGAPAVPTPAGATAASDAGSPAPSRRAASASGALEARPRDLHRGQAALLVAGLLGLLIYGTERRIDRKAPDARDAAPPLESPPSRRRDARYTRVRL